MFYFVFGKIPRFPMPKFSYILFANVCNVHIALMQCCCQRPLIQYAISPAPNTPK